LPNQENEIDEKVFHRNAFQGQKSRLFWPTSAPLRAELHNVLAKQFSAENLDFLAEIHELNSNKQLTPADLQEKLKKIEIKYISDEDMHLNINPSALNAILHSKEKSILDYIPAINEVFDLISANVLGNNKELVEIDKTIFTNKVAVDLAIEFDKITKTAAHREAPGSSKFFTVKAKDHVHYFVICQKECERAQKQLTQLAEDPKLDSGEREKKLKAIIHQVVENLSLNFNLMQTYEAQHNTKEKISPYVEKMITITSGANIILASKESVSKKVSNARHSEASALPETTLKQENNSSLSASLERKFSLSSQSGNTDSVIRQPSPVQYKKSSRAILPPLESPPTIKKPR
jgi:hypothetical protein